MTSSLLQHLVPLGGLAALLVVRLFFKLIRLAVLLVVVGLVVLSALHPGAWQALAHLFGLR
jgi:hypothetical protein